MKFVYLLKIKSADHYAYLVASIHKTEEGAIKERMRAIDRGEYTPEELEVVTRFLNE